MLNEQTINKLEEMRLKAMARAFKDICNNPAYAETSFEERFGMLVDAQWINHKNNQIARLFKTRLVMKKHTMFLLNRYLEELIHFH